MTFGQSKFRADKTGGMTKSVPLFRQPREDESRETNWTGDASAANTGFGISETRGCRLIYRLTTCPFTRDSNSRTQS